MPHVSRFIPNVKRANGPVAVLGQSLYVKVEPASTLQCLGDHAAAKGLAQKNVAGGEEQRLHLSFVMQAQGLELFQNQQPGWPPEIHRECGEGPLQQVHPLLHQRGIPAVVLLWVDDVQEPEDGLAIHLSGPQQAQVGEEVVVVGDGAVVDADDVAGQQGVVVGVAPAAARGWT